MDAAVAGLVGALGGATLGAVGAWGTALVAFRAARYQADRQADSQHQQWLRQIRRETYSKFLEAAEASLRHMYMAMSARHLPADEEGQAERLGLCEAATAEQQRFEETRAALNLEAPVEIRDKAAELARFFAGLFKAELWIRGVPRGEPVSSSLMMADMRRTRKIKELIKEIQELCPDSLTGPQ